MDDAEIVRRGVVAVIWQQGKLLVIHRSEHVVAPGAYCFPGGGIEPGEEEAAALVRELQEELGVAVTPLRRIWESVTSWRVALAWWQVTLPANEVIVPNALEVAATLWQTPEKMAQLENLLPSNRDFLAALAAGEIVLEEK